MFSRASYTQRNGNFIVIKLELFGNILLFSNTNDLKHYGKIVYGVELPFAKCNPSIIEGVESSSVEYNLLVIQGVESSSAERNAFVPTKLLVVNDVNDIKLRNKAIIRANEHFFKSATAISKYVEIINFDKNCLII